MKIGLVGFAGSGKTTVFNTMTGQDVPVGHGGGVRLGMVRVPDERIDRLSQIFSPRKTTFAEMSFCDVPGEHGAAKRGLSPRGLQQIRDQEALCLVLRDFDNPALEDEPDPLGDLEAFHSECIFADHEIVEKRLDRARKERIDQLEIAAFEIMLSALESERALRSIPEAELDRKYLKGFGLLSDRPLLITLNRAEDRAAEPMPEDLAKRIEELQAAGLTLSASVEADIASMDGEDQAHFLSDLGLSESAIARFIRAAYGLLDLISFFTVSEDEVRAWTIRRGTKARPAAGKIHSDLERGFIRAEVTPYELFMEYGSEAAVKDAGKLQVEGKEYVVSDGDIMHVRFNV
ncbi:MAG: redox-regulated ATPase YchF [Gemmatimonadetes bacterium]|nr:redox-regulated ATPase YchF [Gemmatimonadota bacterium]